MSTSTTVITSLFCKKEIQFGEALTRQIPKRLQKKIRKGIKRGARTSPDQQQYKLYMLKDMGNKGDNLTKLKVLDFNKVCEGI